MLQGSSAGSIAAPAATSKDTLLITNVQRAPSQMNSAALRAVNGGIGRGLV